LGNGLTEASSLAEGQQFIDHNRNKAIGGKITWELGQGFQLGYSRQQGKYDDQGQRQLVLDGYHLAWRGKNSSLIGEYILGSLEVPSAFAQGRLLVSKKLITVMNFMGQVLLLPPFPARESIGKGNVGLWD